MIYVNLATLSGSRKQVASAAAFIQFLDRLGRAALEPRQKHACSYANAFHVWYTVYGCTHMRGLQALLVVWMARHALHML